MARRSSKGSELVPATVSRYDDSKYRAESAFDTLARAQEIQKDKGLMRDVKKVARDKAKTAQGIAGKVKR